MNRKDKTPEREALTHSELLQGTQNMIRTSNYRQIRIIHNFVKSLLEPGG